MFTGIVEDLGTVRSREAIGDVVRFVFESNVVVADAKIGDSIAVNGCCLTVVDFGADWWSADAVKETLDRTNLDQVKADDRVNLERPVRLQDRLGGHLVQGHVDAVGTVLSPAPDLEVQVPSHLLRYIVEKGSITVDGCSLTVVKPTDHSFTIAVIPHTSAVTTLGLRQAGDRVNLEVDVMAKYAERLLVGYLPTDLAQGTN